MSREINPLKNIIYNKKYSPNQPNQPNQLERSNCSFWILSHIARGFRTYAKFSGKTVGSCVEEALLEYMKNHPTDQVSLNLTVDMNSFIMDLDSRLKLKLLKIDLEKTISNIDRMQNNKIRPGKPHQIQNQLRELHKLVKKAIPFSHYPDIREILEKAEEFI